MSSLVRSLGYEAMAFAGAADFLASPHLADTSCAVADIQMPGMTGLDLQRELASRQPDLPIILITGFPEERTRLRAIQAGAAGFFSKPIDSRAFIACLKAALKGG